MNDSAWDRSVRLAEYIIEHHSTVRATAKAFGISKSTVHKDLTERLKKVNPILYGEARKILDLNKQERHIRGGLATKEKYRSLHEEGLHKKVV
ncbi:MAG: sporulation transcriptional regulator SpoIIID [Oscillospiraceae bacterium]|nr:sporulation transcriptional regulator SpoIIID [Oscillospiraceae bacterium]